MNTRRLKAVLLNVIIFIHINFLCTYAFNMEIGTEIFPDKAAILYRTY